MSNLKWFKHSAFYPKSYNPYIISTNPGPREKKKDLGTQDLRVVYCKSARLQNKPTVTSTSTQINQRAAWSALGDHGAGPQRSCAPSHSMPQRDNSSASSTAEPPAPPPLHTSTTTTTTPPLLPPPPPKHCCLFSVGVESASMSRTTSLKLGSALRQLPALRCTSPQWQLFGPYVCT